MKIKGGNPPQLSYKYHGMSSVMRTVIPPLPGHFGGNLINSIEGEIKTTLYEQAKSKRPTQI